MDITNGVKDLVTSKGFSVGANSGYLHRFHLRRRSHAERPVNVGDQNNGYRYDCLATGQAPVKQGVGNKRGHEVHDKADPDNAKQGGGL